MVLPIGDERLPRAVRALRAVEGVVATLLVVSVLSLVIFQVVTRYVLARPVPWSEELARFALIWLAFIGAAWVAGRGSHVTVVLGDQRLGRRARAAIEVLSGLLSIAICTILLTGSLSFLERADRTSAPATGLAMGWVYGASVLAYVLILVHTVVAVIVAIRHPGEINREGRGMEAELAGEDLVAHP